MVLESVLGGGDGAHTKKNECAEGDEGADLAGEGEDRHDNPGEDDARDDGGHRLAEAHPEQIPDDSARPAACAGRGHADKQRQRQPAGLTGGEAGQFFLGASEERLE